jgi:hypothetical protein
MGKVWHQGKEVASMYSCLSKVNQSGSRLWMVVQFSGVLQLSMFTQNARIYTKSLECEWVTKWRSDEVCVSSFWPIRFQHVMTSYWGLAGAWFSCTNVQRLINSLGVQQYNWSKHSACTTSLNENAVDRSKSVRKGSDLIFQFEWDLFFWHFLIRWDMSRLGHFHRFPMALIQSRRTWAGAFGKLTKITGNCFLS